ncbi:Sec-independent protein translocase protein TatB [Sphingosinicella sp. LHD-64]|uniref:Sec-independent protein translocase protein TatB n=1 Tax=Sphingosinicella sp. LHD-64 TaxID=3072139 RepID=UPI00280FBA95|nr:Sec-independent protein translocase protein TatB [Sphingosinicella sp. LHD-64]MDQ8758209.1 Sec-independent protein translocase protein TatB [Sphingosinicella sp. LHD-64]
MFGIDSGELLIIAVVALLVIGPKDLPRVMRTVGHWVGRARGMARHFRSGLDTMIREAELEEMEQQWKANNERIMREGPSSAPPAVESDWGKSADVVSAPADPVLPLPLPLPEPATASSETPVASKPKAPPRRAPRARKASPAPPIPAVGPASATDDRP